MLDNLKEISDSLKKIAVLSNKKVEQTITTKIVYTKLASEKVLDFIKFYGNFGKI